MTSTPTIGVYERLLMRIILVIIKIYKMIKFECLNVKNDEFKCLHHLILDDILRSIWFFINTYWCILWFLSQRKSLFWIPILILIIILIVILRNSNLLTTDSNIVLELFSKLTFYWGTVLEVFKFAISMKWEKYGCIRQITTRLTWLQRKMGNSMSGYEWQREKLTSLE